MEQDLRFLSLVHENETPGVAARLQLLTPKGRLRSVELTEKQLAFLVADGAAIMRYKVSARASALPG